jgi:ABC-2 type transport system ATP-binding protein
MLQENPATDYAIIIENLEKVYSRNKRSIEALKGVSFNVEKGSMFALLGPNGAGKSTLINIIADLVKKTGGKVKIAGIDIDADHKRAKYHIGIVPQELNIDPYFTPLEVLELQAGLYGVPKSNRKSMELLAALDLTDKAHSYTRTLSGGMKRRLMVAKAMVHDPEILILDEPTAGVDVELRQGLWQMIKRLNREQHKTIILTTHYLEEAEELCNTIAIMNKGQLVTCSSKQTLMDSFSTENQLLIRAEIDEQKLKADFASNNITATILEHDTKEKLIKFAYANSNEMADIISAVRISHEIADIVIDQPSLEDIFIQIAQNLANVDN